MRDSFNKELLEIADQNSNVFLLTADIGFQVFDEFRSKFTDRFLNMGVAEANMIGVASGMTLNNKIPICYTIIPFLIMRAFEQIRTDVCIQNLPVKLVGVGGGVSYGTLGPTHHSLVDLAIMRSLPNMTVISPADPLETKKATSAMIDIEGPVYVRLGKNGEPNLLNENYNFEIGKGVKLKTGSDISIISTGSILSLSMNLANELKKSNIDAEVINMHTLKPIDKELIYSTAKKTKKIITLEEHNIIGGLGSAVAETISEYNFNVKQKIFGINDKFNYGVGSQEYHLEKNGLSVENLLIKVKNFLKDKDV